MTEFELNSLRIAADLYVSFYRAGHNFNTSIDLAARQLADANSGRTRLIFPTTYSGLHKNDRNP
jgi:hypothetical protein